MQKKRIYNLLSLWLMILFLFPSMAEDIHNSRHAKDFHCNAKSERHLHTVTHHCPLCESIFPYDKAAKPDPAVQDARQTDGFDPAPGLTGQGYALLLFVSLRAPPGLA